MKVEVVFCRFVIMPELITRFTKQLAGVRDPTNARASSHPPHSGPLQHPAVMVPATDQLLSVTESVDQVSL